MSVIPVFASPDSVPLSPPTPMAYQGRYFYDDKPTLRTNGAGDGIRAQYSKVVWTWERMEYSDFRWWKHTLLKELATKEFTISGGGVATQIENIYGNLMTVRSVRVNMPTWDYASGGFYYNVKVIFDRIIV